MSTTKTNWANRTKAQLTEVTTVDDASLKTVGGNFEEIIAYYQYTAPRNPSPKTRVLAANETISGTYEGSFTGKKFGKKTHKVRTTEGLIGLAGSGQLDKLIGQVAEGATVKIVYRGSEVIKAGNFAGKSAHSFLVRASEMKAA